MKKHIIILVGVLLITAGLMSGCTENKTTKAVEQDIDGDGYNDTIDMFPSDQNEWTDSDGDGVGDNSDAFPLDANETQDTDGDGVGDNADAFPNDPTETVDSDGDGVGDNADYYPYDPTRWERPSFDAFLQIAQPYLDKLDLDDSGLQAYTNTILSGCDASNTECFVNAIYRDVLMNYTCLVAPMNDTNLQTPQETIVQKKGTCEDLSILLCSLLSSIGLNSYLVFTSTHVYAMVSDVNSNGLWNVSERTLINHVETIFGENISQTYDQTIPLPANGVLWAGAEQGKTFSGVIDSMTVQYNIQSDRQLTLFIVPTWTDYNRFMSGDFTNFTTIGQWNFTTTNGITPTLTTYGGIILYNGGNQTANITYHLVFSFEPSFYQTYNKNALNLYQVWGKEAAILNPTLGVYGFPGYDAGIIGEKTVLDPATKAYVTLQ